MDKYPLASLTDQELIIEALINLINSFPDIPKNIKEVMFYDIFPNKESLGIATTKSAIVFKKYIGGSYIGQYNFRIHYRYATKNYKERIQKQSLISTIGEWMEQKTITKSNGETYKLESYPQISDYINIISIEIIDRTILIDKDKSGYEDSIIDLRLKYHAGKDEI